MIRTQMWAAFLFAWAAFAASARSGEPDSLRADLDFFRAATSPAPHALASEAPRPDNEAKLMLFGLLRFYQVFWSSQDGDNCVFTPSCSRFGAQALRHYGLAEGLLMTSDRLQRCHGFALDEYTVNAANGRAEDPVTAEALWH